MAITGSSLSPSSSSGLIGCERVGLFKFNPSGAPFTARISAGRNAGEHRLAPEGPSCIFTGPIETASQETLEALYRQARDAYYSGTPLIVDDMFDRVELKLRWYGSKTVVKYPRCSIRRQSVYADAEGRKTLLKYLS